MSVSEAHMRRSSDRKTRGAYYTPPEVVRALTRWAARRPSERMIDPSCGDGRFLAAHPNSVGVEQDARALAVARNAASGSLIHQGDFFGWAAQTHERFDCAAGNPPFIRYQRFTGEVRRTALDLCARHGAEFTALCSSWAPFLVATATLLKPGGRMAFVVPAEIGHAPYARPVLEYMAGHFSFVQVVAYRERMFEQLSEDCWLLYAEGYGGRTQQFGFTPLERFEFLEAPPVYARRVRVAEWRMWNGRLRPFLLSREKRELYLEAAEQHGVTRLGEAASVSIGYVTGANDFFHLRPSEAENHGIPHHLLRPAVRSGRTLTGNGLAITRSTVNSWRREDQPNFLLHLSPGGEVPASVQRYLDSPQGKEARGTYKCRNREPWYVVPDVTVPDAFLSYMSGRRPSLVANQAGCVATNSVHVVKTRGGHSVAELQRGWDSPLTQLSCELEGHPLGGGMLKLEPGEAARVLVGKPTAHWRGNGEIINDAVNTMRKWRHDA